MKTFQQKLESYGIYFVPCFSHQYPVYCEYFSYHYSDVIS